MKAQLIIDIYQRHAAAWVSARRTVHFTAYDFMKTTDVERRLKPLRGTSIVTNIETAGRRGRSDFGLIDARRVIEQDSDNRRCTCR